MLTLIEKDDVVVECSKKVCKDIGDSVRDECGKYRYRDAIEGYVDEWKRKIGESPNGKIIVRVRHIREDILGKGFEDRSDNAIYMRVKHVLLEYGIDVRLKHHYGANLVMEIANEENIIGDTERARESRDKTAKGAGFDNFYSYLKTTDGYKNKHTPCDMDIECTYYLGYHIRDKIAELFDNVVKNPIAHRHQYIDKESGLWDWKTKDGKLIKHIAGRHQYMIKIDQLGREHEWSGWHWNILGNKVPHYYLLLGYGDDIENLDIVKGWLIPTNERIRRRPFWNREGFTIRTDKGSQLMEMSRYEIGEDKIKKIREIIRQLSPIVIDDMHVDIREQIFVWYNTYFR